MTRPTTLLKVLSILVAAFLAIIISLGLWVISRRDRKWTALEATVSKLTPSVMTTPLVRVPLGRPSIPGNAWDDYLRLFSGSISKVLPEDLDDLLAKGTPEQRKSFIDANARLIELLRSGVRRQIAKAPVPEKPPGWNKVLGNTGFPVGEIVAVAVARARLEAESGNLREAQELLLDVCLFGRDFAGTRLMNVTQWGLMPMETALREIQALSEKMNPVMLLDLEGHLRLLDDYFPDTSGEILDRLLHLGELLVQEDDADEVFLQFSPNRNRRHWRCFYSTRLEAGSIFAEADGLIRQALALKELPWAAAEPSVWALENDLAALQDPVLSYFLERNLDTFRARNTRTYLRMIRMAVHYRATGEVLAINNDQGGPIGTKLKEDSLLIWNERPPRQAGVQPPASQPSFEDFLIEVPIRK